jgi:hypothetical protein
LVQEVEALDDITVANPAWVWDIVLVLFAHLTSTAIGRMVVCQTGQRLS